MQSLHPVSVQLHRLGDLYHWRELPQVSFLLRHMFVMTKHIFCYDKHAFVATKVCLLQQNFCHDKIVCCDKYLSRQKFCCDKHICFSQQTLFYWDKHIFVETKDVFCRNKRTFVAINMCLSQQKFYCNKKKKILVAAPANDRPPRCSTAECYKNNTHLKDKTPVSSCFCFDLLYLLDSTRFEKANPFNNPPPTPRFYFYFLMEIKFT